MDIAQDSGPPSLADFQAHLAREFGVGVVDLPLDRPLTELGFDSLSRMELLAVLDELGLHVATDMVLTDSSLRTLYEAALATSAN